jgi:hypothetical protein
MYLTPTMTTSIKQTNKQTNKTKQGLADWLKKRRQALVAHVYNPS